MRKIYGIGETVLDIIFKNDTPQAAKPGGSVLNSLVSMGRIGMPVSFISDYSQDDVGELVERFLKNNGVNTRLVHRFKKGNTSLAMAFLDENNDAHYTFYKNKPAERIDIKLPEIKKGDIIQYGSFYAIWTEIRRRFRNFIRDAKDNGAIVLYDPNFRKTHIPELVKLKPLIIDNIEISTLIRGSDQDFRNIFGTGSADDTWNIISNHCKCMIYTANEEGVFVRTPSFSGKFPVKKITPLSTIGAGDSFNAGVITSLFEKRIRAEQLTELTETEWSEIISVAVDFATDVCCSYNNYVSESFANEFISARARTKK
ncbi:MAG TPA: PfkB family carbohydrate kinase [Bacteroidales bacterium]|jgi:fructokinase|nr:carbohydrate kinase [Bacteroidales bacterium]OQB64144.1 MAG: Ribokinase [Bacteroidetes bacterium ADurb.Bin145]NMD02289.1 carbohydrate kinase [Bacteroidales bacterium]HOU02778.1 PfkB family carbohydrate kinase [Bacteroidales bacterium]HQG63111.1 PfkB family carbohydrate kinase [Bacteroidales bacterium]